MTAISPRVPADSLLHITSLLVRAELLLADQAPIIVATQALFAFYRPEMHNPNVTKTSTRYRVLGIYILHRSLVLHCLLFFAPAVFLPSLRLYCQYTV